MDKRIAVIILCFLFLATRVNADGYPKEAPLATTFLKDTSTTGTINNNSSSTVNPSGANVVATPPSTTIPRHGGPHPADYPGGFQGANTSPYPGWFNGVYSVGFAGSYPALSTDYMSRYYGPIATLVVLPDGTIADTPAVMAARAAHLAALSKAKALWFRRDDGSYNLYKYGDYAYFHQGSPHGSNNPYYGPLATPSVLPSGYLADTADTAAARVAHEAAVARAQQEAAIWRAKQVQAWG